MSQQNYSDFLNEEQLNAVRTTEGYVRVIASPGSGKTRCLVFRYVYLTSNKNISPENILSVTFTNKAASEMKSRIIKLLNTKMTLRYVSTIHSFCTTFLRENIGTINFPKGFRIIDEEEYSDILIEIRNKLNIDKRELSLHLMKFSISKLKHSSSNYILELTGEKTLSVKHQAFIKEFLLKQKEDKFLAFDDLILFALYILETNDSLRKKTSNQFKYIQVDEFQDITPSQFHLLSILSEHHKNLFVVGDPDQSIYSFARANAKYLLDFDKTFSDVKTIEMNRNYRSVGEICTVANQLISNNEKRYKHETISTRGNSEKKVLVALVEKDELEGDVAVKFIKKYIEEGYSYNDIAVIYRANYQARSLEKILLSNAIPYRIINATEFYQRVEIKIILSFLKLALYGDDFSFHYLRKNYRFGVGATGLQIIEKRRFISNFNYYDSLVAEKYKLNKKVVQFIEIMSEIHAKLTGKTSDIIKLIIDKSGLLEKYEDFNDEDRINNIYELISHVIVLENEDPDFNLDRFLEEIALVSQADKNSDEKYKVSLLTAHVSKGLEFPVVLLYQFSESIFPHHKSSTKELLEEERRLAYVAITRAKDLLHFSSSRQYSFLLSEVKRPSIFLEEIAEHCEFTHEKIEENKRFSIRPNTFVMPDLETKKTEQKIDELKKEIKIMPESLHNVQGKTPKVPKLKEKKTLVIPKRFITISNASDTYRISTKRIQKAIKNNEVESLAVKGLEYVNKKHVFRLKKKIMNLFYFSFFIICILIILVLPFLL
ncbi:MAG: ATP-dependent helicase [Bacilli bacterium]|nr:ATP-dependent helicase [Bacilli bacterium]